MSRSRGVRFSPVVDLFQDDKDDIFLVEPIFFDVSVSPSDGVSRYTPFYNNFLAGLKLSLASMNKRWGRHRYILRLTCDILVENLQNLYYLFSIGLYAIVLKIETYLSRELISILQGMRKDVKIWYEVRNGVEFQKVKILNYNIFDCILFSTSMKMINGITRKMLNDSGVCLCVFNIKDHNERIAASHAANYLQGPLWPSMYDVCVF